MSGATARYVIGDSLTALRSMPDASVDLVLTSPPFLALRSYLPAGDPAKALEMGSEPTPGDFPRRPARSRRGVPAGAPPPHGSLCVELGDTYAGSGGAGGDYGPDGLRDGQPVFDGSAAKHRSVPKSMSAVATADAAPPPPRLRTRRQLAGWPLDKSLCLIPELFRFALVYGLNPLTGRRTPQWRARNVVRWCRPNPPVGALGDKVRPATSDMVIACVDRRRYFDLDAVRQPLADSPGNRYARRATPDDAARGAVGANKQTNAVVVANPAGAPPLDHWWHDEDVFEQDAWHIAATPYKGSHYATWPPELCRKPILAMCPERVCTTCGAPSERVTERQRSRDADGLIDPPRVPPSRADGGGSTAIGIRHAGSTSVRTVGWSDCGHGTWRNGVVLDPFAGSGTTLAVAIDHGRSAIGIDLDHRNATLARQRVGMWLEVIEHGVEAAG